MPLPDIESALHSFQSALDDGRIEVSPGELEPDVRVLVDVADGSPRFTFVKLDGARVTAMVQFMAAEPYEGQPCFGVSWAVPVELRGQGRAGAMLLAAVREFRHQVSSRLPVFWIEAVVGVENLASQRVAQKVISAESSRSIDDEAGVPIFQYFRRIDVATSLQG